MYNNQNDFTTFSNVSASWVRSNLVWFGSL